MKLFYKKMGSTGSVIIILHGLFGNGRNWFSIARQLSKNYQVYSLDLRNHGQSPHSNIMTYEDMVADIIEFKNAHNLVEFDLIGHSMGGKVAMLLALNYPYLIKHLAIIDIAPVEYQHNFSDIFDALLSMPLVQLKSRKQAELLLARKISRPEIRQFLLQNLCIDINGEVTKNYWRFNLPVLKDSIAQLVGFPLIISDKKFAAKSLFIAAENSVYINDSNRKIIKGFFPGANIVKVKNAGHWLHAEQPEVLKNILMGFLAFPKLRED